MKISKLKNYAKIAGGVLTGYPKITVDGLTGLMTDKLKDKSIELLRDNPAMRDIEENITKTVDDTKEILGIKEFERRLKHIGHHLNRFYAIKTKTIHYDKRCN